MSSGDELDLDARLQHLSAQVDAHSRPTGSARAVATARRRRTVRHCSALAAVLVVIVGVTTWPLPRLSTPEPVSAYPPLAPEKQTRPATLTAERLTAASADWVKSWQPGANPVPADLPCADNWLVDREPGGITAEYRSGRTIGATYTVTRYSTANDTFHAHTLTHASLDACPVVQSRLSYEFYGAAPENLVEAAAFSWRDGGSEGTVWIAWTGTELGVLSVTGVTDPPEPITEQIAETLAADLLDQ